MRNTVLTISAAAGVLGLYLGWTFASRIVANRRLDKSVDARRARSYEGFQRAGSADAVQILQFYASPAEVLEGQKVILCYGVEHARTVRIEPGVGDVSPAANRCLDVYPEEQTRFLLSAEGPDGRVMAASFILPVKADPGLLPRIDYFTKRGTVADRGKLVSSLCYEAENVEEVRVEPRVFPPNAAPRGCFYVAPARTTTYTLTITGPKGRKAQRQVMVEIPTPVTGPPGRV